MRLDKMVWNFSFSFAALCAGGCRTVNPDTGVLASSARLCQSPVLLQNYATPNTQCADPSYFGTADEAKKRLVYPWIPCNTVERIDGTVDMFGPDAGNTAESVRKSTFARIYFDWLIPEDRSNAQAAADAIGKRNLEPTVHNPILDTAMLRKIHELIAGAKHNIIMDIFLFGGSLGSAITRDLTLAADRGVDVILLHDNVSKFVVANEMDPLWKEIKSFAATHPHFVALDSNIRTPNRVSSLPGGIDKLTGPFKDVLHLSVAADGRSDHSKTIMVDTLFTSSLSDYKTLKPKAMVSSHNLVDSAASYYHDEAVIITGPAAVSALLSYRSDLEWAFAQAKGQQGSMSEDNSALMDNILDRIRQVANGAPAIAPQGNTSVQPLEISANNEVRNLDSTIIPHIMRATKSIDLYGKIAYNWPLAIALKEAMARGVKVRMILDQQTTSSAMMNAALPYMIMEAPRRQAIGQDTTDLFNASGAKMKESELPVHWFLPFRPTQIFAGEDRSPLSQEIHAKTIIVDGRWSLYGSANMDTFGWAGGFREYSVWVDDKTVADQATKFFDRLWNHKFLSVAHSVWIGAEDPDPEVLAYFADLANETPCLKGASCPALDVIQGGRAYREKGPFRELVRQITAVEARRINQVFPANVPTDRSGQPLCVKDGF